MAKPETPEIKTFVPWAPRMAKALSAQLDDYRALAASRVIKTEEARELIARQIRLIETLLHGEPQTPVPSRHHV